MEFHPIEFRYLRYFITLAEELNYRRAAERLHVSTPALSVQIKKLEGSLGVRLIDRTTARVRLTAAGETLLLKARMILRSAEEAVRHTREAAQEQHEHLCVGIPDPVKFSFIAETISAFRLQMPGVNVSLMSVSNLEEQQRALEENRLHVGFFQRMRLETMQGFGSFRVLELALCALMSDQHPLARQQQVTIAEVAPYPLLATQAFVNHAQNMCEVFDIAGIKAPEDIKTVEGLNLLFAMLTMSRGVSLMVQKRTLPKFRGLALRPVKDLRVDVHAVWKTANETPRLLAFLEQLRRTAARHGHE